MTINSITKVKVLKSNSDSSKFSDDDVAVEIPVAIEYNGVSHVVMLASPNDLQDFAHGFSLSEGIVKNIDDIFSCEIEETNVGIVVSLDISNESFALLKERRRNLAGRTGCGLCGTESIEKIDRQLDTIPFYFPLKDSVVLESMESMKSSQYLQNLCGATHAAAWFDSEGNLVLIREDVGRHNALDKLLGALALLNSDFTNGFLLITSRASYEMIQKAATMKIGLIAAVSAPTSFAIELAENLGICLLGFVREKKYVIYAHPKRLYF
tara:strand:- start:189 stop:989 length:801 start_codon:yes stop_codon:yes gene_type:complete